MISPRTPEIFVSEEPDEEKEETRLTNGDCSHHRRHDDGQSHSTGDHQVPLVVGHIFSFIAVMYLMEDREWDSHNVSTIFYYLMLNNY